jgi:hypothetical protein
MDAVVGPALPSILQYRCADVFDGVPPGQTADDIAVSVEYGNLV